MLSTGAVVITSPIRMIVVLTLLVCVWPCLLAAQTADGGAGGPQGGDGAPQSGGDGTEKPGTRPFRGLFGLGDSERTGASLSGSLFGAYNKNIAGTLPVQPVDPRYHQSGWYTGANASLEFNWRGEHTSANGWGFAGTSYYPDFEKPFVPTYSGGIGISRSLGQRASFRLAQSALYTPYFLTGFFLDAPVIDELPVPPVVSDPELAVSGNTIAQYRTLASVDRSLSRVSTISVQYSNYTTNYSAVDRQYVQHYGSVLFRRRLTRHASLRLGYGYRTATTDLGLPGEPSIHRDEQQLLVGVDYNRSVTLSMSRRTHLRFSTGTSYIGRSTINDSDFSDQGSQFYVTGSAQLVHEIARTWTATVIYRRGVGFSELVFEPIISDSYTATLSGLLGRRDEFTASAAGSNGSIGNTRLNNDYESYRASAQWRHALTRFTAAYVRYAYYKHDFAPTVRLPFGFPQNLNRNGVDFGLRVWLPLR